MGGNRAPRWLVLRNQLSQIESFVPLLPNTDLKAAMKEGVRVLEVEGCRMDDPKWFAFVFGWRGEERISLNIESIPPGSSTVGHGSPKSGYGSR